MRTQPKHACLMLSAAIIALATSAAPQTAHAQLGGAIYCTNCSDIVTQALQQANQVAQLAKMADSYIQQVQQYGLQIQQYQNMLKNTDVLAGSTFGDAIGDIRKIQNVIKSAKGLAFTGSDIEGAFKARYGSFKTYRDAGLSREDMASRYEAWSDDTNDSVLTTFKALGVEAENLDSEEELMAELESRASSADGQMESLQVGNELAVQAVGQMQKLRSLQMLQLQMMARDLQARQDKESAELAHAIETYTAFDPDYAGKTY